MKLAYEGAWFNFDATDRTQRSYIKSVLKRCIGAYIGKPYRQDTYLTYCLAHLPAEPTVIDVGCNVGTTTLPLAKRYPKGTFLAIDAHPLAMSGFLRNARLNAVTNVRTLCAAITSSTAPVRLYVQNQNLGGSRLSEFGEREPQREHLLVAATSLRQAMTAAAIDRADMLKVDVEGLEMPVLESLGAWLSPARIRTIVAEYGPEGSRAAGHSGWELVRLLKDVGYRCRDLHRGHPIENERDIPSLADFLVTDFLFEAQ